MRLFPLVAVALSLVLAGCAKTDEPPASTTSTPTSSTPTVTPTATTPTGTTPTATTPPTNTTPTTMAPQTFTAKGDWSSTTPPGATPPAAKPIVIPAGYSKGNLTVKWSCAGGAPACVAQGVTVKVAGLSCVLADGAVDPATIKPCVKEGAITAGDAKFEFVGEGLIIADATLTAT